MLKLASQEKQERIRRYKAYGAAQNSLLGDILARVEICKKLNLKNDELQFAANEHGKPFLLNNRALHYNISHSGQYVALAIDSEPVGIDIEQINRARPGGSKEKIAKRFFAPDEVEYVFGALPAKNTTPPPANAMPAKPDSATGDSQAETLLTRRFFEVWTKKESRIKWEGKGLKIPLPSFSALEPLATTGNLAKSDVADNPAAPPGNPVQLYYHNVLRSFDADSLEAICHVCSAKPKPPTVKLLELDEFLSNL